MAYQPALADRLRELLAGEGEVVEKKMFGGLAFLVAGHMAVCAGEGEVLLRVDPRHTDTLLAQPHARPCVMKGRELSGWLRVDVDPSTTDDELGHWVEHGVSYVRSLPPK